MNGKFDEAFDIVSTAMERELLELKHKRTNLSNRLGVLKLGEQLLKMNFDVKEIINDDSLIGDDRLEQLASVQKEIFKIQPDLEKIDRQISRKETLLQNAKLELIEAGLLTDDTVE